LPEKAGSVSGNAHGVTVGRQKPDRRVERTMSAIMRAFIGMVIEGNYRTITIAQIVARADIGKSTFYEHFRTKDEVLLASMGWIFAILAETVDSAAPQAELDDLLRHFWANRRLANVVLAPPLEGKLRRALSNRIDERLTRIDRWRRDPTERRIAAVRIAGGQLALLAAWTKGEISGDVEAISEAVRDAARS